MLELKSSEEDMEALKKMSHEDFLHIIESMIGKAGRHISMYMVEWNQKDADRKELANMMNERMHEPTEYLTLVTLLLRIMRFKPTLTPDRLMTIAFKMREEIELIVGADEFETRLQEMTDDKSN